MSKKSHFNLQTTSVGEPHYPFPLWIALLVFGFLPAVLLVAMTLSGYGRVIPDYLIWMVRIACILIPLILWGMVVWDRTVDKRQRPTSIVLAVVVTIICVVVFVISLPFYVM